MVIGWGKFARMTGPGAKRGYALIVVLGTLSIIALLFATASSRLLAGMHSSATEMTIAANAQERRATLSLARDLYGLGANDVAPDEVLDIPWQGGAAVMQLQDVTGLLDLNSAAPEMLDLLAEALDIPPAAVTQFRAWRRSPHRLMSVRDFGRVSGAGRAEAAQMLGFATVYSGRYGIAPDVAPPELLRHLTGVDGASPALAGLLPVEWLTPPSGQIFHVLIQPTGQPAQIIGVIGLGNSDLPSRILEMY